MPGRRISFNLGGRMRFEYDPRHMHAVDLRVHSILSHKIGVLIRAKWPVSINRWRNISPEVK